MKSAYPRHWVAKIFIIFAIFSMAYVSFAADTQPVPTAPAKAATTTAPQTAGQAPEAKAPEAKSTEAKLIGEVVWVKGVVKAVVEGKPDRVLQRRSPIYLHDTITTDKISTGQIVFSDNSVIALSNETALRMDSYDFGKDVEKGKSRFVARLLKGGFRTVTGLIPKDNANNYEVDTPVATIGVRGSGYVVHLVPRIGVGHGASETMYERIYMKWTAGEPFMRTAAGIQVLSAKTPYVTTTSPSVAPTTLEHLPADIQSVMQKIPKVAPAKFTPPPAAAAPAAAQPAATTTTKGAAAAATGAGGGGNSGGGGSTGNTTKASSTGTTGGSDNNAPVTKPTTVDSFCIGG